jgi:hypothetical protein
MFIWAYIASLLTFAVAAGHICPELLQMLPFAVRPWSKFWALTFKGNVVPSLSSFQSCSLDVGWLVVLKYHQLLIVVMDEDGLETVAFTFNTESTILGLMPPLFPKTSRIYSQQLTDSLNG